MKTMNYLAIFLPTDNQTEDASQAEEAIPQEKVEEGVNEKTKQPVITRGTESVFLVLFLCFVIMVLHKSVF